MHDQREELEPSTCYCRTDADILSTFIIRFVDKQKPIPAEYAEIINKHFFNLLAD